MNPTDAVNVLKFLERQVESDLGSPEAKASLQRVADHLKMQVQKLAQPLFNPAAYPIPHDDRPGAYPAEPGMSLRDYFAAKAMQGLLAQSMGTAGGSDPAHGALYAYAMADAMLKERDK